MGKLRLLVIASALAACGDDGVDLRGTYRVDLAVGSAPCGDDQRLDTVAAFLRFNREDLFGSPYYTYDGCTDEAGTDCSSMGGLFGGFYEPIDDGWLGVITSSSGSGGSCLLNYLEQTATLEGEVLSIEVNEYRDEVELPDEMCQPEEAEARGDSMPCVEHTHIDATRL
jgi:hypothetical protein